MSIVCLGMLSTLRAFWRWVRNPFGVFRNEAGGTNDADLACCGAIERPAEAVEVEVVEVVSVRGEGLSGRVVVVVAVAVVDNFAAAAGAETGVVAVEVAVAVAAVDGVVAKPACGGVVAVVVALPSPELGVVRAEVVVVEVVVAVALTAAALTVEATGWRGRSVPARISGMSSGDGGGKGARGSKAACVVAAVAVVYANCGDVCEEAISI